MRPSSILALALLLPLLASPALGAPADDPRPIVQASEILAKIERGDPVEYDGVIVVGDLDLSGLDLPIEHIERNWNEVEIWGLTTKAKLINSSIRITNSEIQGNLNFSGVIFLKQVIFDDEPKFSELAPEPELVFFDVTTFFDELPSLRGLPGYLPSETQFGGDSDFEGAKFSCDAYFGEAVFIGNAYFDKAEFTGDASFKSTVFKGGADFRGTVFSGGDADFRWTQFSGGDADFRGAVFSGGDVGFGLAQFSGGDTNFGWAQFSGGDADLGGAVFSGDAYFMDAEFSGGNVHFTEAKFGGYANFGGAQFSGGSVNFETAEFSGGNAYFRGAEFSGGNVYFTEAKFGGYANFGGAQFSGGSANFERAEFSGDAYFEMAEFNGGSANFAWSEFNGNYANFEGGKFSEDVTFVNSSFDHANLTLENSKNIRILRLSDANFGNRCMICLNETDYERLYVRWDAIEDALVYNGEVYLNLVKNLRNIEYFEDADDCYYQYGERGSR